MVGLFALAVVLVNAGLIFISLYNGRVPARWPTPRIVRAEKPVPFWATIVVYAVGAVAGAVLAGKFIH
jgi:uncharacterized membrane protein